MREMTHQQAHVAIHAAMGGVLDQGEMAQLAGHLAGCPACQAYQSELAAVESGLRRGFHARWDPILYPQITIVGRIEKKARTTALVHRSLQYAMAGVALVSILLLITFAISLLPQQGEPVVSPLLKTATLIPPTATPPSTMGMEPIGLHNAARLAQVGVRGRGMIAGFAWSPDGKHIAVAASGGIFVVDTITFEENQLRSIGATSVAFSPDGGLLASAEDTMVTVLDAASGQELRTLKGHNEAVNSVAFSPDGRMLASGAQDGAIKVWDAATGQELRTLAGHTQWILQVAFSYNGEILASAAYDEPIKLWDVGSGQELRTLEHKGLFAFSPDGAVLASGAMDTIKLWDIASGQVLRTITGQTKIENGEGLNYWQGPGIVNSVAFSPDGRMLASGAQDGAIKVWDAATGQELRTLAGDNEGADQIIFSPDGTQLVSVAGKTIRIWNAASGQELRDLTGRTEVVGGQGLGVLEGYGWAINDVAFSPTGGILAAGYHEGLVNLYDMASGELLAELDSEIGFINSVAFSPDGRLLAAGGGRYSPEERGVQIWNVATRAPILKLGAFTATVLAVAFSPDGAILATGWGNPWGFGPGSVKLWNVATGRLLAEFGLQNRLNPSNLLTVYGLDFSADGTLLAAINGDGRVQLWDVVNQKEVAILAGCAGYGYGVAFSPSGNLMATSGTSDYHDEKADLRLLDTKTGEPLFLLEGHGSVVKSVAFNTDGRVVASASLDGTVRLWDVETGKPLAVLRVPSGSSVAFSPDGLLLATGGWSDGVRLWGVP